MWYFQVAGNVHFAPGKSFQQGNMHVHDLVPFPDKNFDLSHTITKLTFGQGYPGQQNPLDGVFINQTTSTASQAATGMWQYFLKVSKNTLYCFFSHPQLAGSWYGYA